MLFKALAQLHFQYGAAINTLLHFPMEQAHGVATSSLGLVERHIGTLKKSFNREPLFQNNCQPNTCAVMCYSNINTVRLIKSLQNLESDLLSFTDCRMGIGAEIFKENNELIATQTRYSISRPNTLPQAATY